MRVLAIFLTLLASGFSSGADRMSVLLDVPIQLRVRNWPDEYGSGSCVHASTIVLLNSRGLDSTANYWRKHYSGGEYPNTLINKLSNTSLKYAVERNGSPEFLKWAAKNRLGAGIAYKPRHFINLVDFTKDKVTLLDNNSPYQYEYVETRVFLRKWKEEYGGFAFTLVYNPLPPWPIISSIRIATNGQ